MDYTVGQASRLLKVPYWKLHYLHRSRKFPEVPRFNNQRRYSDADLEKLALALGVAPPAAIIGEGNKATAHPV